MRKFPKSFSDILTMEYRWPKKGDRLFRASDDWDAASTFTAHRLSRDSFIWDGYMTAGAALIDEVERRPQDRHTLIYPILFTYRHGLEVAMKWTIEQYGTLANVTLEKLDHDLWELWGKCKSILQCVSHQDQDDALQAVEQVVKDFHDWDGGAMAFRYSSNKNGVTILLPDKPISLQNMQEVMEGVNNFFEGADGMLHDILSVLPNSC